MSHHLLGMLALAVALGMLLVLFIDSELVAILLIVMLIFVGYSCLFCE